MMAPGPTQARPLPEGPLRDALRSADAGNLEPLLALAPGPPAPGRAADARTLLVDAVRLSVGLGDGRAPLPGALARFAEGSAEERWAAGMACAALHRVAALAFDAEAMRAIAAALLRLIGDRPSPELELHLSAGEAWKRIVRGEDLAAVDAPLRDVHTAAAALSMPALVVEAAALRALAALERGDLEAALANARRASRMARTEGLPAPECLASLVLARVRRHAGKPHLAARILAALARLAPRPFRPWLAWESLLAGGPATARALAPFAPPDGPMARAVSGLLGAVDAMAGADRGAIERSMAAVREALAGAPSFRAEAELVAAAIDPGAPVPPELAPWATGQSPFLPLGLDGVAGDIGDEPLPQKQVATYVVARPGAPGRRLLRLGLALVDGAHRLDDSPAGSRGLSRTDAAISVLTLADPAGMPAEGFFRAVYGFGYSERVHKGVLDVLLNRMRKRLGPAGAVRREGDHVSLSLTAAVVVPDTRCGTPTAELVLRVLARRGAGTAEQLAQELQLQVRTVQIALHQLLAEGACSARRTGHHVRYQVQDTTFTDPTALRRLGGEAIGSRADPSPTRDV
jgi:hypothetical protein